MHYFFELIKVSLGKREALSGIPTATEWQEVYDLAKKQTLVGVLYEGVIRLPKEQRPDDIFLMRWYAQAVKIQKKNSKMNKACAILSTDFSRDGRRHVILKGQGVAQYYPNPLSRVSGDIDVWVEGTRSEILDYMGKKTVLGHVIYHHVDVALKDDTSVEIHFMPSMMYYYFDHRRLQHFFQVAATDEFNHKVLLKGIDTPVPVSTLAFNRVYLLVHIYRHLFAEGVGLRQLMDYYFILSQGFTEEERKQTVTVLKSLHMLKFAGAVMYVLQEVFGLETAHTLVAPHLKEGQFLLSEIMQSGNFGKYDDRIKRDGASTLWGRFMLPLKRDIKFVTSYPREVLSAPFFKVFHFCWLKYHGWI